MRSSWREVTATACVVTLLGSEVSEAQMQSRPVVVRFCLGEYLSKQEHPGARLTGENLGNNRFVFTAENVSSFVCRLHPQMADLSKELDFTINGKKYRVAPEADTTHPDYTAKVQCVIN